MVDGMADAAGVVLRHPYAQRFSGDCESWISLDRNTRKGSTGSDSTLGVVGTQARQAIQAADRLDFDGRLGREVLLCWFVRCKFDTIASSFSLSYS